MSSKLNIGLLVVVVVVVDVASRRALPSLAVEEEGKNKRRKRGNREVNKCEIIASNIR